ncbi:1288_t:CDS:1 [Ambispora gerdemannii]|uniref:1288_t:CDS:1 n=1 Tax=Ambispora gerdemannii TaxID=144530 RepID=A0A9N9A2B0_9GLOM|nr:1288_t:CDS:1 [Ambispora gerdemannii]
MLIIETTRICLATYSIYISYVGSRFIHRSRNNTKRRLQNILNLKITIPPTRPDSRLESGVEYEYQFTVPAQETTFYAAWKEFVPYSHGRPSSQAGKLDASGIKAFSLMCASLFGKQDYFSVEFVVKNNKHDFE